jgi:hypothetical protein
MARPARPNKLSAVRPSVRQVGQLRGDGDDWAHRPGMNWDNIVLNVAAVLLLLAAVPVLFLLAIVYT